MRQLAEALERSMSAGRAEHASMVLKAKAKALRAQKQYRERKEEKKNVKSSVASA